MSQPRDDRQDDLFGPRLEEIINLRHPLVRLAAGIDWQFLAGRFSSVCRVGPGQPPLPTRLMAGLLILKHMHNLSDEALCDRWVENPYFQYFCGEVVFQHAAPFDRSSLTRWRQRLGEEQIAALLQESLSVAHRAGALETKDLERVVVDTTVQEKAVAHPTDARLTHRAIWARLAVRAGLRQAHARPHRNRLNDRPVTASTSRRLASMCGPEACRWSTVRENRSGVAELGAEKIDGDHRSYRHGDDHGPAANLLAGKSEVVQRHIAQTDRGIACNEDCAGNRDDVEPAFHLAPMNLPWMDSLDGDQRM